MIQLPDNYIPPVKLARIGISAVLSADYRLDRDPMYALNAYTLFGSLLAYKDHIHHQYALKSVYRKLEDYYTTLDGYCYKYAQKIDMNLPEDFSPVIHNHDNRYYLIGETVKQALRLDNIFPDGYSPKEHTHSQYALKDSTVFEDATYLNMRSYQDFALQGHQHTGEYYNKDATVADTQWLSIEDADGNVVNYGPSNLAAAQHYHSSYMSIVEADKALVPLMLLNSILLDYYVDLINVQRLAIVKIQRPNGLKFGDVSLLWGYDSAGMRDRLAKLSSFSYHQYLTPPSVLEMDMSSESITLDMTAPETEESSMKIKIVQTYLSPGRWIQLLLKSRTPEHVGETPPVVIDLTPPATQVDSDVSVTPVAANLFISSAKIIINSEYYWQLLIYRYNVAGMAFGYNNIIETPTITLGVIY